MLVETIIVVTRTRVRPDAAATALVLDDRSRREAARGRTLKAS